MLPLRCTLRNTADHGRGNVKTLLNYHAACTDDGDCCYLKSKMETPKYNRLVKLSKSSSVTLLQH